MIGLILVVGFAYTTGNQFATALFPTMALLSGFIITGFVIGYLSKGITIIEPGIGAIVISIISFFVLPVLQLKGFQGMWNSDWIIVYMNAIILTHLGAWLGEKFQHGNLPDDSVENMNFEWGWIFAGTIMGVTSSMLVINVLVFILGYNPDSYIIPYFISLLITGLVVGWKSPGITIKEAGIGGFLTITIVFNIVRLTLNTESEIGLGVIIAGFVIGSIVSLIGGYLGEKIQLTFEKAKTA
jgi:uncharacterized MnhB-related membrane protein